MCPEPSSILNDDDFASYICSECEAILGSPSDKCPKCGAEGSIDRIEVTPKLYDEDFGIYDKYEDACDFSGVPGFTPRRSEPLNATAGTEPPGARDGQPALAEKPNDGAGAPHGRRASACACGIPGFDSLFNGAAIAGTFHLFVGPQSSGKTSFFIKIAEAYADSGHRTLYISSEESGGQMSERARRMKIVSPRLFFSHAGDMDLVMSEIVSRRPEVVFLDSMSGFFKKQIDAMRSSSVQIRECAAELSKLARDKNITVFAAANDVGPSTMREFHSMHHFFDSVVSFEAPFADVKLARVIKSRTSRPGAIAVFRSDHDGLVPTARGEYGGVLIGALDNAPAAKRIGAVSSCYEDCGVLIYNELEAIVSNFPAESPQWSVSGGIRRDLLESVAMIVEKYGAVNLHERNLIVRLKGPSHSTGADFELSLAAALASSAFDIPLPGRTLFLGGLDYSGAVLPTSAGPEMLRSLINSGFQTVVSSNLKKENFENLSGNVIFYNIQNIKYLRELLSSLSLDLEKTNG